MKKVITKIVCTLGPSSEQLGVLRRMMNAGMDVARLNFSHGSHPEHLKRILLVRQLNKKYHRRLRILQDLEGFRIRIGTLERWPNRVVILKKHQKIRLSNNVQRLAKDIVPFDYEGALKDIKAGSHFFIDDGNIVLCIKKVFKDFLEAVVIVGGTVKENKGINIPDVKLKFSGVTDKDRQDLLFGIKHNVDFIAQSFVRDHNDILNVKDILRHHGSSAKVIAKIECREAIEHIDDILSVCDGVMVARGDLGVCLPIYTVPFLQKMLIKKSKAYGKFVITATQMLESMTEHVRPTRAEVADVANAIIDGTDYTMLSGETAAGQYPVEAVAMMNSVARYTESCLANPQRMRILL